MMLEQINNWLTEQGVNVALTVFVVRCIAVLMMAALCFLANWIAKRLVLAAVHKFVQRSKNRWDDIFVQQGVFRWLAHLAPGLVIYLTANVAFAGADAWIHFAQGLAKIYMILVGLLAFDSFLNSILRIYDTFEISRQRPIKFYLQVVKIIAYLSAGILILAVLLNQSPFPIFAGLGTLTAVLMLVFKDSILGFVAGIQISGNDMLRRGDWIEMPQYGADGDVTDISLTTVKVQNWDKTISTIPPYSLVTNSFKNWRGMSESGGRRIKRVLHIDMHSIKFCDEEMLDRFAKIQYIHEYIEKKRQEVAEHNRKLNVTDEDLANGRRLTNVGTFRAYMEAYLRNHPKIHQDMTLLVRHLAPGPQGLPIEIYAFSNDQQWANYESIQADLFDHFLAVLPCFDLRVYQEPSGADVRGLIGTKLR